MAGLLNRLYQMLNGSHAGRKSVAEKTRAKRRLRMEMLEGRELMAANISGVVFNDTDGSSTLNGAEVGLGGVSVQLFNDLGAVGTFDAADTLVTSVTSSSVPATLGQYSFNITTAGNYLVRQVPTSGFAQQPSQRTQAVNVSAGDLTTTTIVQSIDSFDSGAQNISVLTANPIGDSATDVSILGTERDILANRLTGAGDFQIAIDQANNNLLRISTDGGTTGRARVIYDGGADADKTTSDGSFAPAIDLTSGNALGIRLNMRVDANGAFATLIVKSASGTSTSGQIAIPNAGTVQDVLFPFGSGTNAITGTADLTQATSIELIIDTNADADVDLDQMGTYRQLNKPISLANVPAMSIGNQVFIDRNNNGIFEPSGTPADVGIPNVTLQLFTDTDNSTTFTAGTDLPTLDSSNVPITTTTNSSGVYTFTNLLPGRYFVVIPSSQTNAGGAAAGMVVSAVTPALPNNGNKGVAVVGTGIVSSLVSLNASSAPVNDGDTDPNTDLSFDIGLVPQFDLTVAKTSTATAAATGSTITYTITARNDGPSTATGVGLTDNVPDGLQIVSVTSTVNTDVISIPNSALDTTATNPDDVTIDVGTLAASATTQRTITVVAIVLPVATGTGSPAAINNSVTIAGVGTELTALPNTSTLSLPVQLVNDLSVVKTVTTNPASTGTPAVAIPGSTLTYTIVAKNDGPSRATAVRVLDNIPDGIQILTATSSDNTDTVTIPPSATDTTAANPDDLSVLLGELLVGTTNQTTITITALVLATTSGIFTNAATIASTNTAENSDPTPANNTSSVDANAQRNVDLVVTKSIVTNPASTATPAVAAPGSTFTYTILARNDGPFAATTVRVTDDIPDGIRITSVTSSDNTDTITIPATAQDTTPANGDNITIDVGNLAVGAGSQTTITIIGTVLPGTLGNFTNTATIAATDTAANIETVTTNNTSSITATAPRAVDLGVTKNGPATAVSGNTITYTMTATNNGPSDATGVQVVDNIPDGIRIISATINGNAITIPASASDTTAANPDDLTFTVGALTSGASNNTIIIVAAILPGTTAALVNSAVISTTDTSSVDSVTTNNNASVTTTLTQQNDVTITKTGPATIAAGSQVTYTMNVTNNGPSTATSINVADTLPTGVTFVSGTSLIGTTAAGTVSAGTGNTANVTIPTLAPGETAIVTILATVASTTAAGNVTNTVTVTAANDTVSTNNTATASTAVTAPASTTLSGRIYVDSNNDGVGQSTEPGIAGVTVTLTGTPTGGNATVTQSTTTDANGTYTFTNVASGSYSVTSTSPNDFNFRAANPGTTGGTAGTLQINAIPLAGTQSITNNVGFTRVFSKRLFLASGPTI